MAAPVDQASVFAELKDVRRAGLVRLRGRALPALERAAAARIPDGSIEALLRLAVARVDADTLRAAAEYTLGLAQGTRDWPASSRRTRAAQVYGVSVERFRKDQELMVLGQIADHIVALADGGAAEGWGDASHRHVDFRLAGRSVRLSVHVHPVDLLRDVDVVVSPTNTHFALPETYKSSVSASLRRAGAVRGVTGDILDDPILDELRKWPTLQGASGHPVLPGTVAATGSGALASQGIRRIYHAAIAVPRAGTNDYDVLPADVTRAVSRALALLADEHERFTPPLRTVCFPLLGSGRGGLPYEVSLGAVWAAVEAEFARGARWDVHFVVRAPAAATLLERLPTRIRPSRDQSRTGQPG
ncbi:macro domain-containing protein [Streptomyces sp. N2-109]|uniref:Macro domain-containing protein n=1 Tax=Streptomyces gossypii TaxID=2883101 RepID=A0ABT2JUM9_9ACTN|nr:macro domain-containing protein [Streptomyces gossypii]MCT2591575.1 macro domain-containing protein [Streptomyces gossypii]